MTTTIVAAFALEDDVLLVRGTIDDGDELVEARGWVSALEQHYPPDAYDDDGNLREDEHGAPVVLARPMDEEERLDYCKRLLEEQNPRAEPEAPAPSARDLGISG